MVTLERNQVDAYVMFKNFAYAFPDASEVDEAISLFAVDPLMRQFALRTIERVRNGVPIAPEYDYELEQDDQASIELINSVALYTTGNLKKKKYMKALVQYEDVLPHVII